MMAIDHISKYHDMVFSLIPNKTETKKPDLIEYKPYYNKVCDAEIKSHHNIGVMLGRPSNNLIAFDDDTYSETFLDLFPEYREKTFCTKSGQKGGAIFFRMMDLPEACKFTKDGKSIELFTKDRQIILPPSIHPNTKKQYKILHDNPVYDLTKDEFRNIINKLNDNGFVIEKTKVTNAEGKTIRRKSTKELLESDWAIGDRYDNFRDLALRRFHEGWTDEQVRQEAYSKNKTLSQCHDLDEVDRGIDAGFSLYQNNLANPQNGYFEKKEDSTPGDIVIDDTVFELEKLNDIDDAKYANKIVKVKAVVASNSITYNVPTKIQVVCYNGNSEHNCNKKSTIDINKDSYVSFVEIQESQRKKILFNIASARFTKDCSLSFNEIESTTIRRLRVRPIISSLHKKNSTFFDDAGNEWSAYDVYIMQSTIQNLEAGKEVEVLGTVIADPKTGKITILISEIKYLDENKFDTEKIDELVSLFADRSIEENMNWLTDEFEKFSKIVKRKNVTETGLLSMFSPLSIEFEGKKVPSWIKSTIIGDSTTGKSETIRQLIILLKAGQIISGEMASVAGLAGASVQASGGQWFLDFGVLPLNDKKYLAIDGAHKLKKDEMDRLAEAERTGKIEINKAAKGEAYARTRQTKILNPLDEDGITTVTMDSFLFPVHSLKHSFQIQSIARIDLCCFVSDDVDVKVRNVKGGAIHDARLDNMADLIRLIWSKNYEIKFDDTTIDEILNQAIILENKFKNDEYPLITNDQKYKIAKLSTSLACLLCSFGEDYEEIIVTKDHVQYISKLIDKEYCKAGLDEIVKQSKFGAIDLDIIYDLVKGIGVKINDDDKVTSVEILKWCATQSKITRDDLQEEFALSRDKQAQPLLTYLKNEKILKTSRNHYSITKKGVSVARFIANFSASSASSPSKTDTPLKNKNDLGGVSLLVDLERLERLKIKTFVCNDCNTTWKNTKSTLEELTKNHNNTHTIMEETYLES